MSYIHVSYVANVAKFFADKAWKTPKTKKISKPNKKFSTKVVEPVEGEEGLGGTSPWVTGKIHTLPREKLIHILGLAIHLKVQFNYPYNDLQDILKENFWVIFGKFSPNIR